MKTILTALLMCTAIPAFANDNGVYMDCQNPATSAKLQITQGWPASPRYLMNKALITQLLDQGSDYVPESGWGTINRGSGNQIFSAGEAHGYSVTISKDSGGVKLVYSPYGTASSNFFFRYGECRFSE